MRKKIQILLLFIFISGGALFAQQNTPATPDEKKIYIPVMTKEQKADKIIQEKINQAVMKKNDLPDTEKNAVIYNETEINPAIIEKSQYKESFLKNSEENKANIKTEKDGLKENEK